MDADIGQLLHYASEDRMAEFRVSDLASSEEEADLHLVALVKKLASSLQLYFEIVVADLKPQAYLLHLGLLLILLAFGKLFRLLVAVLAVVEDLYDRRLGSRGDFS